MSFPTYKEVLPLEISWENSFPTHWKTMQLKRTVENCQNGIWGADPLKDGSDTIVLRVADFDRTRFRVAEEKLTHRQLSNNEKKPRMLKHGDLLIEKSGGGEKQLVGQVVLFDKEFEAVTSNFVARMTPNNNHSSRYLNYIFARFYAMRINYCSIKQNTGIQNLDTGKYLQEAFALPPLKEQQAIASFLDYETARIDTLIEKQQKLITLLKEKRMAVISHAVTKGLDPNVPMKESGVEWLGEVPEHWAVCKLNIRYSVELGKMLDEKKITGHRLIPYFRNKDVQWGTINSEDLPQMDITVAEIGRYTVSNGDLLVCEGGDVGRAAIWRGESMIFGYQKALHKLRPRYFNHDISEFFFFVLMAAKSIGAFEESDTKATISHLPAEKFRRFKFPFPPKSEQIAIIQYLTRWCAKIDHVTNCSEKAIALLQERRTALISTAVTGKIDVRNHPSAREAA